MRGSEIGNHDVRDDDPAEAGPFIRIAFSFLGLLSGFAVLFLLMFAMALREHWRMRADRIGDPNGVVFYMLQVALIYAAFSLVGWIITGPIFAVAVPARVVARIHPLLSLGLGMTLGLGSMLIMLVAFFIAERQPFRLRGSELYWILSAVVAGPAFVIYSQLLRRFEVRGGFKWRNRPASPRESA
jgi:hypothetical protein